MKMILSSFYYHAFEKGVNFLETGFTSMKNTKYYWGRGSRFSEAVSQF